MLDGYIYNALRTPFGRHAGALARLRPDDMLAAVISEVVKQSPFDPEKIEDVVGPQPGKGAGMATKWGAQSVVDVAVEHGAVPPRCISQRRPAAVKPHEQSR